MNMRPHNVFELICFILCKIMENDIQKNYIENRDINRVTELAQKMRIEGKTTCLFD